MGINSKASSDKRRLESAVHTMHAEIDDMLSQAKNSEEKSKRAMVDAARLADELRAEQDHSSTQEKAKRSLETQVSELEMRLAERRIKELQFQTDEDHKNQERMTELASKLQQKIKTYKKQIEEAEEIAALNLAKFRKAQQDLEETEERSKMADGQLSLLRAGSVF